MWRNWCPLASQYVVSRACRKRSRFEKGNVGLAGQCFKMSELVCSARTMFFYMFGFYTAWMLGIAALAYQKLKGFDDYATHFVGRKDYGIIVMMLTMFASWISGNTITNVPNASSALGYTSFYIGFRNAWHYLLLPSVLMEVGCAAHFSN